MNWFVEMAQLPFKISIYQNVNSDVIFVTTVAIHCVTVLCNKVEIGSIYRLH